MLLTYADTAYLGLVQGALTFRPKSQGRDDKEKDKQMKNLVMIVALLASASISAMANDTVKTVNDLPVPSSNPNVATAQAELPLAKLPQTPTPMSWVRLASADGPRIPAGWQIVGIETVLSNGNSVNRWIYYLYNPSTRATAGWIIQVN